jgi:hydrogenase/urease accessory protein HupE
MRRLIIAITIAFISFISTHSAYAHELLPKEVVEYMQAHPEALAEDIKQFISTTSPELAQKYQGNQEQLIDIARNVNVDFWENTTTFLKLGIGHILEGTDHILFVLSLLLAFVSIRKMLKLTLAFTIAHSTTLLLAGSGLLTLSSSIVEPIIALSISYVALTTVFLKNTKYQKLVGETVPIVFMFGLFHGLGFAGLLSEIQIPQPRFVESLLFFNVGIELGQILIIALSLPLIYGFKDTPWYPKAIKILGIIFGAAGLFWVVQRIFFS